MIVVLRGRGEVLVLGVYLRVWLECPRMRREEGEWDGSVQAKLNEGMKNMKVSLPSYTY